MGIIFVPAIKLNKIPCLNLKSDVLITLDLEDPVPQHLKESALNDVINYFDNDTNDFHYLIRVNSLAEQGLEEIKKLKEKNIDKKILGFIIPKANMKNCAMLTSTFEDLNIIPVIETVEGFNEFDEICRITSPMMVMFGLNDFGTDVGIIRPKLTKNSLLISGVISQLSIKAKYYKTKFLVGAYIFFDDKEGFKEECLFMKELGVDLYICIHFSQLEITDEVFSVSKEELEWSQMVIENHDGNGCISKNNLMYGPPHYKLAKAIIGRYNESPAGRLYGNSFKEGS